MNVQELSQRRATLILRKAADCASDDDLKELADLTDTLNKLGVHVNQDVRTDSLPGRSALQHGLDVLEEEKKFNADESDEVDFSVE